MSTSFLLFFLLLAETASLYWKTPKEKQCMDIFISRDLEEGDELAQLLRACGHRLRGQSLLQFYELALPEAEPVGDYYVFYSARAVQALYGRCPGAWQRYSRAVLGKAAEAALLVFGLDAQFVGTGNPEESAKAFLQEARGKKIIFWQAQESRASFQKLLGKDIQAQSIAIYGSRAKGEIAAEKSGLLIFTSPKNARAYFAKQPLRPGQELIAIGSTTGAALEELGYSCIFAENPYSQGLFAAIEKAISRL